MKSLVIGLVLMAGSAHAYSGACLPADVGTSVTMCDSCNKTKCVPKSTVQKRSGWLVGRCFGNPMACTDGAPDSICCVYSNGSLSTASGECPKCDGSGATLVQSVPGMKADPATRLCAFDEPSAARAAIATTDINAFTMRIVGGVSIDSTECNQPVHTKACCSYQGTTSKTDVDDTCTACPLTLGGNLFDSCQLNYYASGDGQSCVPNGQ